MEKMAIMMEKLASLVDALPILENMASLTSTSFENPHKNNQIHHKIELFKTFATVYHNPCVSLTDLKTLETLENSHTMMDLLKPS